MAIREKVFSDLSRSQVADFIEYSAFCALALSILALALKGIAVALGFVAILAVGPFITASIGLFITFIALVVFSVILDYETVIEAALESREAEEAEEDDGPREVNVQQSRQR